jgi:hypothetical protein
MLLSVLLRTFASPI